MHSVGFEPTSANTLELESSSLDRSDTNARDWSCGESNPGLSACKADALPLCHSPDNVTQRKSVAHCLCEDNVWEGGVSLPSVVCDRLFLLPSVRHQLSMAASFYHKCTKLHSTTQRRHRKKRSLHYNSYHQAAAVIIFHRRRKNKP